MHSTIYPHIHPSTHSSMSKLWLPVRTLTKAHERTAVKNEDVIILHSNETIGSLPLFCPPSQWLYILLQIIPHLFY